MKKALNEKETLKKLKIADFTQLKSDKFSAFTQLLTKIDTEVIMKAFDQVPEFTSMVSTIVSGYKETVGNCIDSSLDDSKAFNDACNKVLDSLQKELDKKFITAKRKEKISQQMLEVIKIMKEHNMENKHFLVHLSNPIAGAVEGIKNVFTGKNKKI